MSDFASTDSTGATAQSSIDSTVNTASAGLGNAKDAVVNNASAAANAVQNSDLTKDLTNTVANGPLAENIKDQHARTKAEFSNLAAAARNPPSKTAAGEPYTDYHSFFISLLSWENPRASGIAFLSTVLFIFAARYLDIFRYALKLTYVTLGFTVLAEVAGKLLFSQGFASQFRPRKYYTIPKETLDSILSGVYDLINFFVTESQRILFAENVYASAAAFLGAFFSYYLIKIVPAWGLALISTSVLFLSPLLYKTNQELIDHHLRKANEAINQQTEQVKKLANHHASRATDAIKQSVGEYSAKAEELIGNARGRSASPTAPAKPATSKTTSGPTYKSSDFPAAPKEEFKAPAAANPVKDEPLIAT